MIRITQTFLVNSFATHLRENGWNVLYEDYVDARRGGAGSQGVLNYCFEVILDQFPDVVAVKRNRLLIIEVDLAYKDIYAEKLTRFKSKEHEIFQCIKGKLDLNVEELDMGLVLLRRPPVAKQNDLKRVSIWLYNTNQKKFSLYK